MSLNIERRVDYCKFVAINSSNANKRNISVSSKLKRAHQDFVPHKVVIGQQEVDDGYKELKKLAKRLAKAMDGKPFLEREGVAEISKQV